MKFLTSIFLSIFLACSSTNASATDRSIPTLKEISKVDWSSLSSMKETFGHLTPLKIPEEESGGYAQPNMKSLFNGEPFLLDGIGNFKPTLKQENIGKYGFNMLFDDVSLPENVGCEDLQETLRGIYGPPKIQNNKSIGNIVEVESQWVSKDNSIRLSCSLFPFSAGASFPLIVISFADIKDQPELKESVRLICSNTQSDKLNNDDEKIIEQPPVTIIIDPTHKSIKSTLKVGDASVFNDSFIVATKEETKDGLKMDFTMRIDRIQGTFNNHVVGTKGSLKLVRKNWGSCERVTQTKKF